MPSLEFRRVRSEEHTSELQSHSHLVCRLLLEKKKKEELPTTPVFDVDEWDFEIRGGDGTAAYHTLVRRRRGGLRDPSGGALAFFFFNNRPPPELSPLPQHAPLRT